MELKLVQILNAESAGDVSIVPKWNWNWRSCHISCAGVGINRTKVELKWRNWRRGYPWCLWYQSYQSGIEMRYLCFLFHPRSCINRTKVELKSLIRHPGPRQKKDVSIVPKWNWNIWKSILIKDTYQSYQSYQSGIEISKRVVNSSSKRSVSIVPKWNWNDFADK